MLELPRLGSLGLVLAGNPIGRAPRLRERVCARQFALARISSHDLTGPTNQKQGWRTRARLGEGIGARAKCFAADPSASIERQPADTITLALSWRAYFHFRRARQAQGGNWKAPSLYRLALAGHGCCRGLGGGHCNATRRAPINTWPACRFLADCRSSR